MDFRGFDSSIIFKLRGGIPRPIGNLPESLSQAILVGITLVGKLAVPESGRQSTIQCNNTAVRRQPHNQDGEHKPAPLCARAARNYNEVSFGEEIVFKYKGISFSCKEISFN